MSKPIVRCRCGHQILHREVLRVEPYERASGAEFVYVKYRCRCCKRMGEAFIPELQYEWAIFAAPHNEMSVEERDRFLDEATISLDDVSAFKGALEDIESFGELENIALEPRRSRPKIEKPDGPRGVKNSDAKDSKNSEKGGGETPPNVESRK